MSGANQSDESYVSTGPEMQEDWTYKAEMPMLPEKYQNGCQCLPSSCASNDFDLH